MTTPITEAQLVELERLHRKGPFAFRHWATPDGDNMITQGEHRNVAGVPYKRECEDAARWLCAAANAALGLVDEVRRLRAIVDACARAGCPTAATASSPASSPPPRSKD